MCELCVLNQKIFLQYSRVQIAYLRTAAFFGPASRLSIFLKSPNTSQSSPPLHWCTSHLLQSPEAMGKIVPCGAFGIDGTPMCFGTNGYGQCDLPAGLGPIT